MKKKGNSFRGLEVIKKNGFREEFNFEKIKTAVTKTLYRCGMEFNYLQWMELEKEVKLHIVELKTKELTTVEMHNVVMRALKELKHDEVYEEYLAFRGYKESFQKVMREMIHQSDRLLGDGDKENSNRNADLIEVKKGLFADILSGHLMMEYELPRKIAKAHQDNLVYVHDMRDWIFDSINCCLFDMGNVLKGGYEYNGVKYAEPNSVTVAGAMMQDIMNCSRLQQYGGWTLPEIDKVLAPYVEKTYDNYMFITCNDDALAETLTRRDTKQVFQSLDHALNMVNNTFITISFGMDTSKWGQLVTECILESRMDGLGINKMTTIFPKLVFLHREEVNGAPWSPNYHLKEMAIECSFLAGRSYPDFLSLDYGYLAEVYERTGLIISPMGCRAFLSVWMDKDKQEVYTGRANCGAITLNLPKMALQAKGDPDRFLRIIEKNFKKAIDAHLYRFNRLRNQKASSNPLFFCQGGCHMQLDPNDMIEEVIKTFTWAIGFIGLEEATKALTGMSIVDYPAIGHRVMDKLNMLAEKYTNKHGLLFSIYATPAESLCHTMLQKDRNEFGIVAGVTDKDWYTNSFHVDVRNKIALDKKMETEAQFFHKSRGGRISYTEFPMVQNYEAGLTAVNYAMELGLYYGINLNMDLCNDCGHRDEFQKDTSNNVLCPMCHSDNVISINRNCGYLGYTKLNGDTRMNKGKQAEIDNRVKHI